MRLATPNFGSLEGDFAAVAEVQGDDVSWTALDSEAAWDKQR